MERGVRGYLKGEGAQCHPTVTVARLERDHKDPGLNGGLDLELVVYDFRGQTAIVHD